MFLLFLYFLCRKSFLCAVLLFVIITFFSHYSYTKHKLHLYSMMLTYQKHLPTPEAPNMTALLYSAEQSCSPLPSCTFIFSVPNYFLKEILVAAWTVFPRSIYREIFSG